MCRVFNTVLKYNIAIKRKYFCTRLRCRFVKMLELGPQTYIHVTTYVLNVCHLTGDILTVKN